MKIKLRNRNQITLPEKIVKDLNLVPDDEFIVSITNGHIELIPAVTVPKDEAYLFTPQWQNALKEAERDLDEGKFQQADNASDMIKKLNED